MSIFSWSSKSEGDAARDVVHANLSPSQCRYILDSNRRCRRQASVTGTGLCLHHEAHLLQCRQDQAAALRAQALASGNDFTSALAINRVLGNLLALGLERQYSPRELDSFTRILNSALRSLREIESQQATAAMRSLFHVEPTAPPNEEAITEDSQMEDATCIANAAPEHNELSAQASTKLSPKIPRALTTLHPSSVSATSTAGLREPSARPSAQTNPLKPSAGESPTALPLQSASSAPETSSDEPELAELLEPVVWIGERPDSRSIRADLRLPARQRRFRR